MPDRPISVYDAVTHQRLRLTSLPAGAQLCTDILGYYRHPEGLTAYTHGTTPPALRTAVEEGRTADEVLLADISGGIQEINLADCRYQFKVLLPPPARVSPITRAPAPAEALAA